MLKNDIIVIVLVIAFIAVSIGSVISYQQGYEQGIQYQRAQPVNITVESYAGTTMITTSNEQVSRMATLGLSTTNDFVRSNNITAWDIRYAP